MDNVWGELGCQVFEKISCYVDREGNRLYAEKIVNLRKLLVPK